MCLIRWLRVAVVYAELQELVCRAGSGAEAGSPRPAGLIFNFLCQFQLSTMAATTPISPEEEEELREAFAKIGKRVISCWIQEEPGSPENPLRPLTVLSSSRRGQQWLHQQGRAHRALQGH